MAGVYFLVEVFDKLTVRQEPVFPTLVPQGSAIVPLIIFIIVVYR